MNQSVMNYIQDATVYQRLEIVEEILTGIQDLEITDGFREELKRRKREVLTNHKRGRTWQEVRKMPRNTKWK